MEKKSLAKNSIFNMAYKGFTALFPLVTTTYISRALLPEGVGAVAYANTIASYFVLLACLGLPNYGVKVIAQNNGTKRERSRTFYELFFINLVATAICTAAYYLFVNTLPHFADRRALFNIMGLLLVLNVFNIDWFYQGVEEYGYIAVRSFAVKVLSFAAMLLFVHDTGDRLIYALILCIATAGNNLLNAVNMRKYVSLPERGLALGRHMRPVLILLASTIATEIYTMLDTVMLEYFHGEAYVGYYSNAVKIVRMTYTVVIAFVAVYYPRVSMHYKQGEQEECNRLIGQGTQILLVMALPCAVGLALCAEYIVPLLFKEEFLPAVGTLRILSVLVLVFSIAYFLGHMILTAAGKERMILWATIAGAVVNVIANFLLIPTWKQDGAAIASVLSEVAVTGILLWCSKGDYRLKIPGHYMWTLALSLALMAGAVVGMKALLGTRPVMVLPMMAVAAVVYFGGLAVMRNEVAEEMKGKILYFFTKK